MKSLIMATISYLTMAIALLGITALVREGTMAWYYWAVPVAMVALMGIIVWRDGRTPETTVTGRNGAEGGHLPRQH